MLSYIDSIIANFNNLTHNSPVVAGAVSLWALGVGTYLIKYVPSKIYQFFIKHITTKLTIFSSSQSFYKFVKWYDDNGYAKNARSLKITNGKHGWSNAVKSIGYGTHYFFHKASLIRLTYSLQKEAISEKERDVIDLTIFWRSHAIFDEIFEDIKDKDTDGNFLIINKYEDKQWIRVSEQPKREFDTIFIDKNEKQKLINSIESFIKRADWDVKMGIPHQMGILLYGPPGTGKTSIIKAIASHFNMHVHDLPSSHLSYIAPAFNKLPHDALVIIEDIDTNASTHKRSTNIKTASDNPADIFDLGTILNSIGGLITTHGRILVATTNHIEKLDPALIRAGRFDIKIEVGYATNEIFEEMMKKFYDNVNIPKNFNIKENITTSTIQQSILENLNNPEVVISYFADDSLDNIIQFTPYDKQQS